MAEPIASETFSAAAAGRPTGNPFADEWRDTLAREPLRFLEDGPGPDPTLKERFEGNAGDAFRNTTTGAAMGAMFAGAAAGGGEIAREAVGVLKRDQEAYETMRQSDTPLEWAVAGLGQAVGSVPAVESLLPVLRLGKWLGVGVGPVARRAVEAGVTGAALGTVADPLVQGLRILSGLQEEYDPRRTAAAGVVGFVVPAGLQTLGDAVVGPIARNLLRHLDRPADAPTVAPDAPVDDAAPTPSSIAPAPDTAAPQTGQDAQTIAPASAAAPEAEPQPVSPAAAGEALPPTIGADDAADGASAVPIPADRVPPATAAAAAAAEPADAAAVPDLVPQRPDPSGAIADPVPPPRPIDIVTPEPVATVAPSASRRAAAAAADAPPPEVLAARAPVDAPTARARLEAAGFDARALPDAPEVLASADADTLARTFARSRSRDVPDDLDTGLAGFVADAPDPAVRTARAAAILDRSDDIAEVSPEFGPVLKGYENRFADAAERLSALQGGEARGVFRRPDIAEPIDVVWGEYDPTTDWGYGLVKIAGKHPDIVAELPRIIAEGRLEMGKSRAFIDTGDARAVLRLDFDGERKTWIFTAYEKRGSRRVGGTPESPDGHQADSHSSSASPADPDIASPGPGDETRALRGQLRDEPRRDPGGTPTPREGDAAAAGAGAASPAERLADTARRLQEIIGVPVRTGRIAKRKALGTYNTVSGVIRMREREDLDVLAHEAGHGLHLDPKTKPVLDRLIAVHSAEVFPLSYTMEPHLVAEEGFAEWFRLFVTNPAHVRGLAPKFTTAFETWLRTNRPAVAKGLAEVQAAHEAWLKAPSPGVVRGDMVTSARPPIGTRILRAIGGDKAPGGETMFGLLDRLYTWVIDDKHPVNAGVRSLLAIHEQNTGKRFDLKVSDDPYKLLRLGTNSYQGGHLDLMNGVTPYGGTVPEGPSLAEALELAVGKPWFAGGWSPDDLADFGAYLVSRRAVDEYRRFFDGELPNPPDKFTLGDHQVTIAEMDAEHPTFAQAAELLYDYMGQALRKKLDAGFISRDTYDVLMQRRTYVPFQRDMSDRMADGAVTTAGPGNATLRQSVMKQFRGSTRAVINPIETIIKDAFDTAHLIARNDAVRALDRLAKKAGPAGGVIAERIPAKETKPFSVDVVEALRKAGREAGMMRADVDTMAQSVADLLGDDDTLVTLYRSGVIDERGEAIVFFWEGGERRALRLGDGELGREMFRAITNLGQEASNFIQDFLAVPARMLRFGITTDPAFILANFIRDQTAAWVLNPGNVPLYSAGRGLVDELAQTDMARLYTYAGGIMGGANVASLDRARIGRSVHALRRKGYGAKVFADPAEGARELLRITEISETATRLGLFRRYFDTAKSQGLGETEAMLEAAFRATDYIDFGRHGSKTLAARKLVTFLNAALQGTDKTGRVLFGQLAPAARLMRGEALTPGDKADLGQALGGWAKLGSLTAASLALWSLNKDDPEYQEINEYLRATHWPIKMFGDWYFIPKPFEMATVFNLAERAAEYQATNDPAWGERFVRSMGYTMMPPLEPVGVATLYELAFNYDSFRDRAIVPEWQRGLEPWLQFNAYTSQFGRAVGEALNVSPAKVDHLITGWTGSWGRNILSVIDLAVKPGAWEAANLADMPIARRFVKETFRGSQAIGDFWRLVGQQNGRLAAKSQSYRTLMDMGGPAEAAEFLAGLKDDEKVFVTLDRHFEAKDKKLHPLYRARQVSEILSGIRKELALETFTDSLDGERLHVPGVEARMAEDAIARIQAAEARNALVVTNAKGWQRLPVIDTERLYGDLEATSPTIFAEMEARVAKARVMPFAGVRAVWPELRDRLLKEGEEAFLGDLRAEAVVQ
jgi:hypothetical protein